MLALAAIATLSIFAVACSDDGDDGGGDDGGASTPAATSPASDATEPTGGETPGATEEGAETEPGGVTTIITRDAGELGTILTTADGFTLYTFDNDVPGTGTSACGEDCIPTWPPLSVSAPTAADDVPGEVDTFTREDGLTQVTYNGKPLYRFAADTDPGNTSGDGINGVWHVVAP
jgi:predicted lipoprotein with Yx(FWY)xxD motif